MWEVRHFANVLTVSIIASLGKDISRRQDVELALAMLLELRWHDDDSPRLLICSESYFEAPLKIERY
jgi:hypothetical protein